MGWSWAIVWMLYGAQAQEPTPPGKVTVSVARLPLPAGKKLTWDDLTTVDLPRALVPPTAVVKGTELVGQVLAHPVALQSPIVGQRLEGWVAPPEPEVEATTQVEWDLGPMGALVQAGDLVVWARPGRMACRLAQGEVLSRGAKTTFEVSGEGALALQRAPEAVALLRGPGAPPASLPGCQEAPMDVTVEAAP